MVTGRELANALGRALVDAGFTGRGRRKRVELGATIWIVEIEVVALGQIVSLEIGADFRAREESATTWNDCPVRFFLQHMDRPASLSWPRVSQALIRDDALEATEHSQTHADLASFLMEFARGVDLDSVVRRCWPADSVTSARWSIDPGGAVAVSAVARDFLDRRV